MADDRHECREGGDAAVAGRETGPARPGGSLFNPFELRLFRYTAVLLALVALSALAGVVVWSLGWILEVFYNLLLPLSVAGILALVLAPVVAFLERRLRVPHLPAVLLLLLVVLAGIGGLIFLLVPLLVGQVVQLLTALPEALARWDEYLSVHFPQASAILSERMDSGDGDEATSLVPGLEDPGRTLVSSLGLLAGLAFVPLFLFFTLLSGDLLRGLASEMLSVFHEPTRRKVLYFLDVFVEYVTAFFRGQLIIAACMSACYALGFSLIGLEFGLLVGLVLGLLNIVPFLGTLIGLLVVLPMSLQQPGGGIELLALALLVFTAVQLLEGWFLTPRIMADRSGLHPALVVISLFFWGTALNGVIGMILAVPLTAFIVAMWGEIKGSLKHTLSSEDFGR